MIDEDRHTRITLRIPKDLHSRLAESAAATNKSMNAEIISRLQESFEARHEADPAALQARLDSIDRRLESLEKKA